MFKGMIRNLFELPYHVLINYLYVHYFQWRVILSALPQSFCIKCKNEAFFRCLDCGPNIYFCHDCHIYFHDAFHKQVTKVPECVQAFSHEKHYILSSELKHLYVAVTRARQHIWICDENPE